MAVITDAGINVQTLEESVSENTALYSEKTGEVDVSPSSAAGELVAITSEMDTRNQQTVADAFTQNTVTDATGQNLENIGVIKNQERKENQKSIVFVRLEGVNGTQVFTNTSFICSFNDEIFISDYDIIIASGEAFVSCTSENIGVSCPAETISLETAITDITSVTNQTDAEIGFTEESDGLLRTRLQLIGSPFTNNLKEGLFLALTELENVAKVKILDNNTDSAIDGVPARNFSPVVLGGNRAEIAKTIFRYMGVGNPSFGDVAQFLTSDVTGDLYAIEFNVPEELLTVVAITISTDATFNASTGSEEIKNNVVNYFQSLDIGEDLILQKVEAASLIQGVLSSDATFNGNPVNLFSSFKQLFVTNLSNVTVS